MDLTDLVEKVAREGMRVAEVGVWHGDTTRTYLPLVAKYHGTMYAIDHFLGSESVHGVHACGQAQADETMQRFEETTKPWQECVRILCGSSHFMLETLPDASMDFIFIDADHRYSFVKKDIEISLRKMRPGGILAGHDCDGFSGVGEWKPEELEKDTVNHRHLGVIQAVYDTFGKTATIPRESIWMVNV